MFYSFAFLFLSILVAPVWCKTTFIVPGPNPDDVSDFSGNINYKVGQQVTFKWESNFSTFDVYLLLKYPQDLTVDLALNTSSRSVEWTVDLQSYSSEIPKGEDYVFYLTIDSYLESGKPGPNDDSLYFNVTAPSTGGISATTAAGITVGSTIVGLAIIGGAGIFLWRYIQGLKQFRNDLKGFKEWRKTQSDAGRRPSTTPLAPNLFDSQTQDGHGVYTSCYFQPKAELPADSLSADNLPVDNVLVSPQTPREMYLAGPGHNTSWLSLG